MAQTIISPEQVYSAENVQQAVTNPISMPSDLLGIRDSVYSKYNIADLTKQASDAYKALAEFNQNTISQLNNTQDQLLGMNKITGIQSKISRDRGIQAQGLSSAYDTIANSLNSAYNLANNEFSILQKEYQDKKDLMLQYPDAGIKLSDTLEKVQSRLKDYSENLAKKEEKARLKKELEQYGINTKGLSRRELEKKLRKYNKEALDKIKRREDQEWDMKVAQFNKSMERGSGKSMREENAFSEAEIKTKNENAIYSVMSSLPRGADNYTNPNDWKPLLNEWLNADMPVTEFFNKFGQFINPNDI